MARRNARRYAAAVPWFAALASLPSLFILQCSLEGLNDGRAFRADAGPGQPDVKAPDAPAPDANPPRDAEMPDGGDTLGLTVIVAGLDAPDELVLAAPYLYFTTGRTNGAVERCSTGGSEPTCETLITGQSQPRSLVAAHGVLAWVNSAGGEVMIGAAGAPSTAIQSFIKVQPSPQGVAPFTSEDLAWTNGGAAAGEPKVARRLENGILALSRTAESPGVVIMSSDGKDVVWGESGGIAETPRLGDGADGGKACLFIKSGLEPESMVLPADDNFTLYWTSPADQRVLSARRPSAAVAIEHCDEVRSEAKELAIRQGRPWAIAVDAKYVYFTVNEKGDDGSVRRVPRAGGIVDVLLTGLNEPHGLAIDDHFIYVVVAGNGTILRFIKPK